MRTEVINPGNREDGGLANARTLSVVMPVYNGERFVAEAIESILRQTWRDFEFIIVDDGSTDGTRDILAGYAQSDERVRVLQQPENRGLAAALNVGCMAASGGLIARMDADDISLPDRFEKQLAFLRDNPRVGVVGAAVQLIDETGRLGIVKRYPEEPALIAWSMLFFNSVVHPSVIMRREAVAAVGFYPPGNGEDYGLFAKLSFVTRLVNLPAVLLLYRTWPGSVSRSAWERQEQASVRVVTDAVSHLIDTPISAHQASQLRGLSNDRYPDFREALETTARLIQRLRRGFVF